MFINNPRPKLVVLCGLPASGKSSILLAENEKPAFVYSTDSYIEQVARTQGKTYSECFENLYGEALKFMNESVERAIVEGTNVIWDQTNLTVKKRKEILNKFPTAYERVCAYVYPPETDADKRLLKYRLENRPGKVIPAKVVESMKKNFQEPLPSEGFDTVFRLSMFQNVLETKRY